MLKDTKTLSYAILALQQLAKGPSEGMTIAMGVNAKVQALHEEQISGTYLTKVLAMMSKAGLISSDNRGYKLSRRYDDLTLADVMEINSDKPQSHPVLELFDKALTEHARTLKLKDFVLC